MNKERTPEAIFLEITELCAELGWLIGMEEGENGDIKGIVTGTGEYVVTVLDQMENGTDYSIYQHGPEKETELH